MAHALRLLALAAACAGALALPATAGAAVPGVNVSFVSNNGDPYVRHAGNMPGDPSDTARTWQDLQESGARTVRTFANWTTLRGPTRNLEILKFRQFAAKARARNLDVIITLMGGPDQVPSPGEYAAVARDLASELRGTVAAYEVWNEPDEPHFWAGAPQPAAYTALLRAAYGAFKAGDPGARVLVGGLVANNFEFVEKLYANGAKGSFDGVGIHLDTACLTTDPREYYREPDGRVGRYSFTGYREVRRVMLANGDDKPLWMTEIGWASTTAECMRGGRAGTKAGGVTREQQADFLAKAFGCFANDPYVEQAAWFNLHDIRTGAPEDHFNLGLVTDGFLRKPAFSALQAAAGAGPIACGGSADSGAPTVTFAQPTDGARFLETLPIDIRASDAEGVKDIDLLVDGREIGIPTKVTGTTARAAKAWTMARKLSYGEHTLTARARDEARNVGTATVKVIRVGGGRYRLKVPTRIDLTVGPVRSGKVSLRGRVVTTGNVVDTRAFGTVKIRFFKRRGGGWAQTALIKRNAKAGFRVSYRFAGRGHYKVTATYKPRAGKSFARSRAPATLLQVR